MRKDSLDRQLQGRPKPEDLIQKGILNGKSGQYDLVTRPANHIYAEDEDPRE
jgi:hypothetical protein